MKRLITIVIIAAAIILPGKTDAQVNIQINLGQQPNWGPVGYNVARYYYLPDVESYYDVNRGQFIYLSGRNWVFAKQLPGRYRNYNLYNGYKVVINEPRPYLHFNSHKVKYVKYKNYHGKQKVIKAYSPKKNDFKRGNSFGKGPKNNPPGHRNNRH